MASMDGRPDYWISTKGRPGEQCMERLRVYADPKTKEIVWRHFAVDQESGGVIDSLEVRFSRSGDFIDMKSIEPTFYFDPKYYKEANAEYEMKKFLRCDDVLKWLRTAFMPQIRH